jgi:hypothetical protein
MAWANVCLPPQSIPKLWAPHSVVPLLDDRVGAKDLLTRNCGGGLFIPLQCRGGYTTPKGMSRLTRR